jgi:hypothetical protein
MNEVCFKLSKYKIGSIEKSIDRAISIFDSTTQEKTGYLIPVGNWISTRDVLIEKIAEWRNGNLLNHFSRFPANLENARMYIEAKTNSNNPSIFFLIHNKRNGYIGHIAVENIRDRTAEIGNFYLNGEVFGEIDYLDVLDSISNWLISEFSILSIYIWFLEKNPNLTYFSKKLVITSLEKSFLTKKNLAMGFQLLLSDKVDPQNSERAVKLEIPLPLRLIS